MLNYNFNPFPAITTDRLLLRRVTPADEAELYVLRSDVRVLKYLDPTSISTSADIKSFMQMIDQGIEDNKWLYWGICLKDQPAIIGTICLWNFVANENKAEIGYMMHPDQQGKGFMNEATRVVLSYGLQKLGLQCIEAFTHVENEASIKLLLKNNFLQCEHAGIPEHSTDLRFCIKP